MRGNQMSEFGFVGLWDLWIREVRLNRLPKSNNPLIR